MGFDVSLTGDKALTDLLLRLENKAAGKVIRPALRKAAKEIRVAAVAAAPRLTGATALHIVVKGASGRGIIAVQVRTGKRSEMGIPGDAKYYYPAAYELGSDRQPARPWLRPTLDAYRSRALATITDEMWRRVEQLGLGSEPPADEEGP